MDLTLVVLTFEKNTTIIHSYVIPLLTGLDSPGYSTKTRSLVPGPLTAHRTAPCLGDWS